MSDERKGLVILGYGPTPVDLFGKAAKVAGNGAVIGTDVARMAGASFAVGTPDALAELQSRLEAGALQAERAANPSLSPEATAWLAGGERGVSSDTMFEHLTGIKATGDGGATTRTTRAISAAAACCSSACRSWFRCSRGWLKSRRSGRRWSPAGTACARRWTPRARTGAQDVAWRRRPTR